MQSHRLVSQGTVLSKRETITSILSKNDFFLKVIKFDFRKEKSKRKFKPSGLYPSVNVPRKGEKERKKLKEEKNKHKDEKLITGNGKSSSVDLSKRKIRKDKIPGPPYVCQGCHATYSQRKTLRIHVKSGKCQGVPKTERPKHKVIKGRYFCLHPVCVPPNGELGDQVTNRLYLSNFFKPPHGSLLYKSLAL